MKKDTTNAVRKAISLLLMVIVSSIPFYAVAMSAGAQGLGDSGYGLLTVDGLDKPLVSTSSVVCFAGEEVTISVSLADNPGISNFGMVMQYDTSVLTYVSSRVGDIIIENFTDTNRSGLASNQIRFRANTSSGETIHTDGTLYTVTLRVREGQESGTLGTESLAFMYLESMFDGFTLVDELLNFEIAHGSVSVFNHTDPLIYLPHLEIRAGQEMTVPITLTNNPGISNYGIVIQYDPAVFTYISSGVGDIITENFGDTNVSGLASNQVRFRANTSDGSTPGNDGTLFTVTLLVSKGLDEGTLPAGSLSFSYPSPMFDGFTLEDTLLLFGVVPGSVTIKSVFYGDVNGDEALNGIDQTWMNRFFSGLLSTTQSEQFIIANADVNGDGALNGIDQTRMNRFFSGLDTRELGQR